MVRIAIYEKGLAAGVGLKASNPKLLAQFIDDPDRFQLLKELLLKQIEVELAAQGVSVGIDEGEIREAVHDFSELVSSGEGDMVSRKVATGQPAGDGIDGNLSYLFNPDGVPLKILNWEEQKRAARKVHRVKQGEAMVRYEPPVPGQPGQTVRGEVLAAGQPAKDVSLNEIVGVNTRVEGHSLVAEIDGVYREDLQGAVKVVQELEVEDVNAATGDLPVAGIGEFNACVHRGVAGGAALQTKGDVFVGDLERPGAIENGTRIRAGNLCVNGPVSGDQVPDAYLTGEVESMDPEAQEQVQREMEDGLIEVEGVVAAREILARNVRAGEIMVTGNVFNAALEVQDYIWIDGNLVGGMVSCGGRIQVAGDLGNAQGSTTRIFFSTTRSETQKLKQTELELLEAKEKLAKRGAELQDHMANVDERGRQSPYWASLLNDEKRAPSKPLEKRLLTEFLKASKERQRLEQAMADAQRYVWDLEEVKDNVEEDESLKGGKLEIAVKGTVYPGVSVELVRSLEERDLKRPVKNRAGMDTAIQMVRNKLAEQVNSHIELYREGVEERRKALEEIYKDRDDKPPLPEIPNKRFEEQVFFADEPVDGGSPWGAAREGVVYVYASQADSFFLKQVNSVKEPVSGVLLAAEQPEGEEADADFVVSCKADEQGFALWQENADLTAKLDELWVLDRSGRMHLFDEERTDDGTDG